MNYRTEGAGCREAPQGLGKVRRKNAFLGSKDRGAGSGKNSLFPINTADSSRRASRFKCLFVFFHLQNFALKIYTSLFKNQTRSAKKKPIQNPEETGKGSKTAESQHKDLASPSPLLLAVPSSETHHLHCPSRECEAPCSPLSHTCFLLPLASQCRAQLASAFYDQAFSKPA